MMKYSQLPEVHGSIDIIGNKDLSTFAGHKWHEIDSAQMASIILYNNT